MKKIILGMVFVFATGTMLNAKTITNDNAKPKFTFEQCDGYATVVGALYQLSYEEEHNEFVACMELQE